MDTPYQRPSSAQPAWFLIKTEQASWAESLGVDWMCPILKKIYLWNPHEKFYKMCIGHQNP